MRRLIFGALLATLLGSGCGPASEPSPKDHDPVAIQTPPVDPKPAPPEPDPAQKDPRYNPSRVYQLSELRVVDLEVGGHKFKAWVMDSAGKRQEGMMFLKPEMVEDDEAMLFVFAQPQPLSFWMENCPMGLDIAYVSEERKVLNIQSGKPYDESPLPADGDSQFVLEFKEGTCKRLGIKPGAKVSFPEDVRSAD